MEYQPVIGLEVHAELATQSKMFCASPVVDSTRAQPNTAVCPVCAGMPGTLPVTNAYAVELALRVALALNCEISQRSIFARKNYFYPDLPKGYQISQYEQPLARNGRLTILTPGGEKVIRIRRVHLEEDTGKLTHVQSEDGAYSLVDLNRAGVPLLEIVTEPDLRSAEEVRLYATALRSVLRYVGASTGDMEKGALRIEPNVSVRPLGSSRLGTRVEVKNLNSFRSLEKAVAYEIRRQAEVLARGELIRQETVGWDVEKEVTFTQRVKEGEEDYRYFPEPDLPPLVIDEAWIQRVRESLPELPLDRLRRYQEQHGLSEYDAGVLAADRAVGDYFEQVLAAAGPSVSAKMVANWVSGEVFSLLNQAGQEISSIRIAPQALADLVQMMAAGEISSASAKLVLSEMFSTGRHPDEIVVERGLQQISDERAIASLVSAVLDDYPEQVNAFLGGKETVARWLIGKVARLAEGKANPQIVQTELQRQLEERRKRGRTINNQ